MANLLSILDTDGLKHPNLKFDPQNPAAHLPHNHPDFKKMREGLSPEQLEILDNSTNVAGFNIDELDDEEELSLVDPETGLDVELSFEVSLEELGLVDPAKLKTLTMEAFMCTGKYSRVLELLKERHDEVLHQFYSLGQAQLIDRMQADNVNAALGGTLGDSVIMESFTQMPSKNNFSVVMEQLDNNKTALAVGGAIVSATIVYALIRWFTNMWNKNSGASKSIVDNVRVFAQRKDTLKNAPETIDMAKKAFAEVTRKMKDESKSQVLNLEVRQAIRAIKDAEELTDKKKADEFLKDAINANIAMELQRVYSNLWASIITGRPVETGNASINVNADFFNRMRSAALACQEICNIADAKLEAIKNTPAASTVSSDTDKDYQGAINKIAEFAKVCGHGLDTREFASGSAAFSTHVLNSVVSRVDTVLPRELMNFNIDFINENTFDVVNDDFLDRVTDFGKTLEELTGEKKTFGRGTKDAVNVGDAAQRDSRVREYNKAAGNFRGAMNVMRSILAIRNNIGNGMNAIVKGSAPVGE